MAISFRDVVVTYKERLRGGSINALDHANLDVPYGGGIYGLLGPSGCGKTTSLLCCLGLIRPRHGKVEVFGKKPKDPELGVPGSNVGYMPQKLALHSHFTVKEILSYYCCIHGVDPRDVTTRTEHFLRTFGIPDKVNSRVDCLSEGQRRRVSLACSVIHFPKLLLLDEPTVGVDPLLRQAIWAQLHKLVEEHKSTIIISTHYIQEAEEAHRVGFLRSGKVIAEGSPKHLTTMMMSNSLEDVFYKICINSKEARNQKLLSTLQSYEEKPPEIPQMEMSSLKSAKKRRRPFLALLRKNWAVCKRHWTFLLFFAALPLVTYTLVMHCIGPPPKGLHLGLVNDESDCLQNTTLKCDKSIELSELMSSKYVPWQGSILSCDVLKRITEHGTVDKFHIKTNIEDALEEVTLGHDIGVLHFKRDFSNALWFRIKALVSGTQMTNETLESSFIAVKMDATNQVLKNSLTKVILESLQTTMLEILGQCGQQELAQQYLTLGVEVIPATKSSRSSSEEDELSLSYNMLPGLIILVLHLGSVGLTADHLVTEKEAGILEREMSAGINIVQLLTAQMIAQCSVVIPMVIASMIFLIHVGKFDLDITTQISLGVLCFLQAVSGMAFGFLLTAVCNSRDQALQAGVGIIMPEFLFSGILWPSVAMPYALKIIADMLPVTLSCELARTLSHQETYRPVMGMIMPLIWITIFTSISVWLFSRKLRNK